MFLLLDHTQVLALKPKTDTYLGNLAPILGSRGGPEGDDSDEQGLHVDDIILVLPPDVIPY